jgi:hypothetical protein
MKVSSDPLGSLPLELSALILSFLEEADLKSLSLVCKKYRRLTEERWRKICLLRGLSPISEMMWVPLICPSSPASFSPPFHISPPFSSPLKDQVPWKETIMRMGLFKKGTFSRHRISHFKHSLIPKVAMDSAAQTIAYTEGKTLFLSHFKLTKRNLKKERGLLVDSKAICSHQRDILDFSLFNGNRQVLTAGEEGWWAIFLNYFLFSLFLFSFACFSLFLFFSPFFPLTLSHSHSHTHSHSYTTLTPLSHHSHTLNLHQLHRKELLEALPETSPGEEGTTERQKLSIKERAALIRVLPPPSATGISKPSSSSSSSSHQKPPIKPKPKHLKPLQEPQRGGEEAGRLGESFVQVEPMEFSSEEIPPSLFQTAEFEKIDFHAVVAETGGKGGEEEEEEEVWLDAQDSDGDLVHISDDDVRRQEERGRQEERQKGEKQEERLEGGKQQERQERKPAQTWSEWIWDWVQPR